MRPTPLANFEGGTQMTSPPPSAPDFWSAAAPYVAALVGLFAAVVALLVAWISHSAKISEFRQKWIDDLRADIVQYIGLAEKWIRKWIIPSELGEKARREREEALFQLANDAQIILRRIRLRLNPRENKYKQQDDDFLRKLRDLLDPEKLAPPDLYSSWFKLADATVEQGREILKREWEVTKKLPLPHWMRSGRR
jgi:hypothetical protein